MTVVGRQTAYRMRHCCARRIDKTGGRRKLLRTSTRWAERQRIVGAETSRIAKSLAASVSDAATQAVDSASVAALRAAGLQWQGQGAGPLAFSWGSKGDILSRERISPLFSHPARYGEPLYPLGQNAKIKPAARQVLFLWFYSPSSTARRRRTLPSSASSIVWISTSRSRLSVPPRGR